MILLIILILIAWVGTALAGLETLFGLVIPYVALILFIAGFLYRIYYWSRSPVPFRIPTTCGQAKSLDWIKRDRFESPSNLFETLIRMAMEILLFRSLFRNTKAELKPGPNLHYGSNKWLWLGGMVFHWTFLVIILRHYRFFLEPIPFVISLTEKIDSFFQVALPILYLSDILILAALTFLILRRIFGGPVRYMSLFQDYFPLYLISGIVLSGMMMRYLTKTDIIKVKQLSQSLIHFDFTVPSGIGAIFYIHLFLVCVLVSYFPYSKLMHMGGIFFSPTRNLANNSREKRHINPWNPDVKIRTYHDYEEDFRDKMIASGIPLDKD